MADKRILIADANAVTLEEFRRAMGGSWEVVGATTGNAALTEAQKQPFDVVVANFELPGLGGAELLNRIRVVNPKSIRFIAAAEVFKDKVMCHVLGGHQFLAIPFDRSTIKGSIERSLAADYGMSSSMRELVGRIRTFPTIPSLYMEVVNALKSPNATTEEVGAIISKDMAMTTKLVQVLNSAYFGLSRTITDPTEAVGILGFETVKSLIMTIKVLSQYDKVKPVYFSIDNIWKHSTNVAKTARVMALLEIGDNDCSATAYTAGLMHDLGKVILAANFDGQYHGAHAVARKQQIPLWEVEKDIFGATHGEIGAYLLGLWGMSPEVVRVAALHHYPMRSGDKSFTALTAVHVANALENVENSDNEGLPPALVDVEYLKQLGLEERVELWREARNEPDASKLEDKLQRAKSAHKAATAAPPSASPAHKIVPVASPDQSTSHSTPSAPNWLGIGLGMAAVVALLVAVGITRPSKAPQIPPAVQIATAAVVQPTKEIATVIAQPSAVEATKPAPAPSTNFAPIVAVEPAKPAPPPPTNPAPLAAISAPHAASPTASKTVLDRLKLQGIFFTSDHPSALISGQLVGVDDEVAGCKVVTISRSSVTLEYENQRKTFTVRQ